MKLSIIIVNYNTKKLLKDCLVSMYKNQSDVLKKDFEVIVVDNASSDGSQACVKHEFPAVKIIESKENLGFGRANNVGAKKAKGEWLLFLNSDTVVQPGFLSKLMNRLRNEKEVIGFRLLNEDFSLQPSAGYFPTIGRILALMMFLDDVPFISSLVMPYHINENKWYSHENKCDWVTGACLAVSRTAFLNTGGFDETIFMYGEEVDLAKRLKDNGLSVIFSPQAEVIHKKGASSEDGFKSAVTGEYKGLITYYKKHHPKLLPVLKCILGLGALLRMGVFGIIRPVRVKAYREALRSVTV